MKKETSGTLVTHDKHRIAYRHLSLGNDKVVIIVHGFYNSKDGVLLRHLAERLTDTYDVIMFDFRGHGESSGLFSWTSREEQDLFVVIEYARKYYNVIGIIAFSLGAAVSITLLAREEAADSLIAVSTPTALGKIDYQFWRMDVKGDILYLFEKEGRIGKGIRPGPFWLDKTDPIDVVGEVKCPVYYIHGDKDWVFTPLHSQRLHEKTRSEKQITIVKNGPHAEYLLKKDSCDLVASMRSWFDRTLKKGETR